MPFVEEGLDVGEPVMVAVIPEHTGWLRDALGTRADDVSFVDMVQLGRNPARIIPAWQEFLDRNDGSRRPVRGIGEPIWPGRRPEELQECQLHEALLNVAIDPVTPFWLICPYDAEQLGPEVVAEAHHSHPVIVEADSFHGSPRYGGRAHVDTMFSAELAEIDHPPLVAPFTAHDVRRLFTYVKLESHVSGLSDSAAADLAAATERLALSSLARGATHGEIRVWTLRHAVICEVADGTVVDDLLAGRRVPYGSEHDGLWVANQLCDLVQLRSTETGTTVRLHAWK